MRRFLNLCGWMLLTVMNFNTLLADDGAVIKGKVEFDVNHLKSWDNQELVIPFSEIKSELFQRIELPPVPVPKNWPELKPEEQQKWATDYEASAAGKQFIEDRDKLIAAAHVFEVKIEDDGNFVIYDVPPGIYGLRGRVDKEIGGVNHGFEIFGQIEILKDMDEVRLDPIQVAVTPLLQPGAVAPPIKVETQDGQATVTLDDFKDHYVFVSFWMSDSPSAEYQEKIQKMFAELKDKYPLKLLSICVDEDRKKALEFIAQKQLKGGSHGFTDGLDQRTLFDFGVRSIPSFWLIGPDGKVSMSQYNFAMAFRVEPELGVIISNRIEGKDLPTPAMAPKAETDAKSETTTDDISGGD